MEMVRKKGSMTKFQILYEISKREPHLRQKDLAERLNMSIQGISEHIRTLIEEGYITPKYGKSPYSITLKGIDKIKKEANDLKKYSDEVLENMSYYRDTWPAIASQDLRKGDKVGIYMDDGILHATKKRRSANATVSTNGRKNEDVALTDLEGVVDIDEGHVVVIAIPNIREGGSRVTDLELVKRTYDSGLRNWDIDKSFNRICVLGTIGYSICLKLDIPIDIEFAVAKSAVEAAKKGLNVLILAVGKMAKNVIKELEYNKINYYLLDAH